MEKDSTEITLFYLGEDLNPDLWTNSPLRKHYTFNRSCRLVKTQFPDISNWQQIKSSVKIHCNVLADRN